MYKNIINTYNYKRGDNMENPSANNTVTQKQEFKIGRATYVVTEVFSGNKTANEIYGEIILNELLKH